MLEVLTNPAAHAGVGVHLDTSKLFCGEQSAFWLHPVWVLMEVVTLFYAAEAVLGTWRGPSTPPPFGAMAVLMVAAVAATTATSGVLCLQVMACNLATKPCVVLGAAGAACLVVVLLVATQHHMACVVAHKST
jgi:hypothetical protein